MYPHDDYTTPALRRATSKWDSAKRASLLLADVMQTMWGDINMVTNVRACSDSVVLRYCPSCNRQHVAGAYGCHHRLCPLCQVRRSRKLAQNALSAVGYLQRSGALEATRMFMLTLTQKNVADGMLSGEIDRLLAALARLRHVYAVRHDLLGSARNIEITRNYNARTWHPHVHLLIIVPENSPLCDVKQWRAQWARLMELDYRPEIDLTPIENDGAVFELSKYVAKSTEMLLKIPARDRVPVIGELIEAVARRNLIAYTGIWRDARRAVAAIDDEFADIDRDIPESACVCGGQLMHAIMQWDGCRYVTRAADAAARPLSI